MKAENEVKLHTTNNITRLTGAKQPDFLLFYRSTLSLTWYTVFLNWKYKLQSKVQHENGTVDTKVTNVAALVLGR